MFPLNTANFPSSAADLESELNRSLERVFSVQADPVSLRDASYPNLAEVCVSLDGARLRENPPQSSVISGKTSPALSIEQLILSASPVSLGPARVNLSVSAREVELGQGKDANGQIILSLEGAADGNIEISRRKTDLEALVAKLAENQAGKQGITIEGVQLTLRQESAHSLAVELHLRARKLFLTASIRVTGQLDLDDELNLKILNLACSGDGRMATLVCRILKPHLQKIDGREFPLMSLPLGKIRLRDVRLTVGDDLTVSAEFASAS